MDYSKNYISVVQKTDAQYHRSYVIIHQAGGMFHQAEFDGMEKLQFYADMLGFTFTLVDEEKSERYGTYQQYKMSHDIIDPCDGGFWKYEDLPAGVKPFKALSNGSIVTCYFLNDGKTIRIYRPNPNAKEIYKPLPIDQHINHVKVYGLY